jgi:nicotinamidase/pyrazinamidase
MTTLKPRIQADDALIVVDVQKDFCPGGALPIPDADEIMPVLNQWIDAASAVGARIVFSRDWHPGDHVSFREQGGGWPPHCLQNTEGAKFHPQLNVPASAQVVSKGTERVKDSYSAFDGTDLSAELRKHGVQRVWIGGLAQDVCVRATVFGACNAGFEVHLVASATKPLNYESGRKAVDAMRAAGAIIDQEGPYESVAI